MENRPMGQNVRIQDSARPQSFYETVQKRIDMAKAVQVVNEYLHGADIPAKRVDVAQALVLRAIPALQAITMNLQTEAPASRHDIDALLLSSGLRPDALPGWKRSDVLEHSPEDPLPPTSEAE